MSQDEWEYSYDKKQIVSFGYDVYIKSQDVVFKDNDRLPQRTLDLFQLAGEIAEADQSVESVLDLGTRDGKMLDYLEDHGYYPTGIDISPRAVAYARKKGRNVIEGDVHNLTEVVSGIKFDMVLACHVLEHCHNPYKVASEVYETLNIRGLFAVRVPIQKDLTEQTLKDGYNPHYAVFNYEKSENLLETAGFKILYGTVIKKDIVMIGKKL